MSNESGKSEMADLLIAVPLLEQSRHKQALDDILAFTKTLRGKIRTARERLFYEIRLRASHGEEALFVGDLPRGKAHRSAVIDLAGKL